jgi:DNA-binding response OmpR family regulator
MFSLLHARGNDQTNGSALVVERKLEPEGMQRMPDTKGLVVIVERGSWQSEPLALRLRQAGYAVQVVPGREAALELLEREHPALLIASGEADLHLYQALRQASPAPLMALTPWRDDKRMLEAFALGVDDYQTASIGSSEVVARAAAMVRRSGTPLEARATSRL